MPTTTTTYSFNKPVVGADEDDWGGYLNGNWDSVDDLLDGTTPVTGIDINSGTLDGVTIGGTTAGAGTFTTLTANTSITGTLATAAQPNITSVGSLTSLDVGGTVTADGLTVDGAVDFSTGTGSNVVLGNTGSFTGSETAQLVFEEGSTELAQVQWNPAGNTFVLENKIYNAPISFRTYGATERLKIDGATGDISFYEDTGTTAKFFWDASAERLGIGTSTPSEPLEVAGGKIRIGNTKIGHSGSGGNWDMTFETYSGGYFERMRIDSSGNLLVGKTSTSFSTAGLAFGQSGQIAAVRSGNAVADFNRLSTDGSIVNFYKDGTTVGSIASRAGVVTSVILNPSTMGITEADTGGGPSLSPTNGSGATNDAAVDLGTSSIRWQDLYLSGGVYLGGTGAANRLNSYEEGTWTPSFTNLTIGNGTVFGTYTKIGRSVTVVFGFKCGSTTSVGTLGDITGLPFTSSNDYTGFIKVHGVAFDSGSRWYEAVAVIGNNSSNILVPSISNYNSSISSTNPMTWTTNDTLVFTATYTTT